MYIPQGEFGKANENLKPPKRVGAGTEALSPSQKVRKWQMWVPPRTHPQKPVSEEFRFVDVTDLVFAPLTSHRREIRFASTIQRCAKFARPRSILSIQKIWCLRSFWTQICVRQIIWVIGQRSSFIDLQPAWPAVSDGILSGIATTGASAYCRGASGEKMMSPTCLH